MAFIWHCPEAPSSTKYIVQYKSLVDHQNANTVVSNYAPPIIYVAQGVLDGEPTGLPGYIHVIPEFAFGTIMAIFSSLSGLAIYRKHRTK